jgi:hypothetical protein
VTDLDLPTLDALHDLSTPGEWTEADTRFTEALRNAYPALSARIRHLEGRIVDFETMADETFGYRDEYTSSELLLAYHQGLPKLTARIRELEADRRNLVHEIRRYASYMLQLTEEFSRDDLDRYQRAMDRAHDMQRKSEDDARANPEEFEANVEQVAKATRELRK